MKNSKKKAATYPEFGVDSRYKSKKEKLSDGQRLIEERLKRLKDLPKGQIVKARLIQLKLKMEEYLRQPVYLKNNFFTDFLSEYIDLLYEKRVLFANDISITPVSLSQILNNHRAPKEEFMLRLMLHSELTFKNICKFEKSTWYQVYYHEKICDTIANQNEWSPLEKKHVNIQHASLK